MTTNITVNALADMLNSLKGSTAISLISVTPPKMKAKCPRTNILKESYKSGLLGCSYENRVNNQLGRENKELDFKAKKMSFGQLSENKVVKTKTNKDGTTKRYIYMSKMSQPLAIHLRGRKLAKNLLHYGCLKKVNPIRKLNLANTLK